MREIKFRAWDINNQLMSYPKGNLPNLYIKIDGKCVSIDREGEETKESDILMQYTGLKDKNNKDIYEGDMLGKYSEHKTLEGELHDIYKGVVSWDNFNGRWSCNASWETNTKFGSECKYYEVIGNIYENPDLITPPLPNHLRE